MEMDEQTGMLLGFNILRLTLLFEAVRDCVLACPAALPSFKNT